MKKKRGESIVATSQSKASVSLSFPSVKCQAKHTVARSLVCRLLATGVASHGIEMKWKTIYFWEGEKGATNLLKEKGKETSSGGGGGERKEAHVFFFLVAIAVLCREELSSAPQCTQKYKIT